MHGSQIVVEGWAARFYYYEKQVSGVEGGLGHLEKERY